MVAICRTGNFDNRIWDIRDRICLRIELLVLGWCFVADVETDDSAYLWF